MKFIGIILISASLILLVNTDLLDDLLLDPDRCTDAIAYKCQECTNQRVRCEYLNLTNLVPLEDTSPDTTRSVIYKGNWLPVINSSLFSTSMSLLTHLDLSYNRIESLDPNTFANLPVLDSLSLDGNRIDLGREETLKAFKPISDSLRRLNMSNALAISLEDLAYGQTSFADAKLHSLLRVVRNLTELRLSNNLLSTFNVDNTIDIEANLTAADRDYEDILCLLPGLQRLYLDRNRLAHIRFEFECVNEFSGEFSLTLLHLDYNRFTRIDAELIKAFRRMKVS